MLTGGRRSPAHPRGYFYEPTVLVDVRPEMRIVRDETFGPTMPIMSVRTIDEAIDLANEQEYGLGANLYTSNLELGDDARWSGSRPAPSGSTTR